MIQLHGGVGYKTLGGTSYEHPALAINTPANGKKNVDGSYGLDAVGGTVLGSHPDNDVGGLIECEKTSRLNHLMRGQTADRSNPLGRIIREPGS